eukprot:12889522-Prorocentrum_lima.AAC.1
MPAVSCLAMFVAMEKAKRRDSPPAADLAGCRQYVHDVALGGDVAYVAEWLGAIDTGLHMFLAKQA